MFWKPEALADLSNLPLLRQGTEVRYVGSIDKTGGNADWDWWLYQDENGEWVIFDHIGPGCIMNLVQHRYTGSPDVTFRFYFDDEPKPRFTIRHSQFGEGYPFVAPLADRYIGPPDARYPTPIRVVRSYVPMPFARRCRVTTDIQLAGNGDGDSGGGGWGHILYHVYDAGAANGIETFSPEQSVYPLIQSWKGAGGPILPAQEQQIQQPFILEPGEKRVIYSDDSPGLLTRLSLRTGGFVRTHLQNLWIEAVWDGHETPDVCAPFGAFFGNELGFHGMHYLLNGMDANGGYYANWPMPYQKNASVVLRNTGDAPVRFLLCEAGLTRAYGAKYAEGSFGYFRTAHYTPRTHTPGADSILANIHGSGHVVGAVITAQGRAPNARADCEGDVRVHIDGSRTPNIQSDGSESYASYGWGFATPPESHAVAGYDGETYETHKNWSMMRHCIGDCYPFLSGVRFGIESGGCNDVAMEHSGIVFYYGLDAQKAMLLASVETGETELEAFFEGDADDVPVRLRGNCGQTIVCSVEIPSGIERLRLRRVSDQQYPCQIADVLVDGKPCPFPWYCPQSNPHKRWLEDDCLIYLGHSDMPRTLHIALDPSPYGANSPWNVFSLHIEGTQS